MQQTHCSLLSSKLGVVLALHLLLHSLDVLLDLGALLLVLQSKGLVLNDLHKKWWQSRRGSRVCWGGSRSIVKQSQQQTAPEWAGQLCVVASTTGAPSDGVGFVYLFLALCVCLGLCLSLLLLL